MRHFRMAETPLPAVATEEIPRWDAVAGKLWWQGGVLKCLRHDAINQRRILDAFEEQGWQRRIDDPLPGSRGLARKSRLREALRGLNRGQRVPALRFRTDGSGTGICWEIIG
jgi:hypothetical protein